jgi:uncharacterized protein (TIGR01777 family)
VVKMAKFLVIGGTGLVGQALVNQLLARGDQVTIGTRSPYRSTLLNERVTKVPLDVKEWDKASQDVPFEGVVNLAGQSIFSGRWTSDSKNAIMQSRLATTNMLIDWMENTSARPKVFVNASAVGFYGPSDNDALTEASLPRNQDFLASVTGAWEKAASCASVLGVRVILARLGIVLARDGGALPRLLLPYRMHVGGTIGSGKQWISWVHINDVVRLLEFALDQQDIIGPMNVTAPVPVTMRDLGIAVATQLGTHSKLSVPSFAIRTVLGEAGNLILTGQKVIPEKAVAAGFQFDYATIQDALRHLLSN